MAVEQDDLVRLVAVDLARMAKSDEVLRVLAPVFVGTRVWHTMKGSKPLAQLGQHGRGPLPIGPAPMRSVGEDRRNDGTNAVVREWTIDAGSGIAEQNGMPETWLISFEKCDNRAAVRPRGQGMKCASARHGDAADAGREGQAQGGMNEAANAGPALDFAPRARARRAR